MLRFALGIALALALPVQGMAQGAPDPTAAQIRALETCVDRASHGAPQASVVAACTGRTACADQTTVGIAQCLQTETAAWDVLLNRWWKPMKARAQADGSWNRLLASQRKWIKDRDAACEKAYNDAGGGSIRVIWAAECFRDRTAAKAVEFYHALYR